MKDVKCLGRGRPPFQTANVQLLLTDYERCELTWLSVGSSHLGETATRFGFLFCFCGLIWLKMFVPFGNQFRVCVLSVESTQI